jgi:hypothetical protein
VYGFHSFDAFVVVLAVNGVTIIIVIIITIIITGKDTISFMQGIYTYIPETDHVPKEYNVAAFCRYCLWRPYH